MRHILRLPACICCARARLFSCPSRHPACPPCTAVGILLYRKHVITEQPYIAQLVECLEQYGLRPLPIFINGVEAHTVVSRACEAKGQERGHSMQLEPAAQ